MDYAATLDYLYTKLPMFTRIGAAAYKTDLHNTYALLQAIGNPHKKLKTVHIAGTNGKGSTSHMLAAIFHAHGYKTGLYTSPHLKDFRERIKISGPAATAEMEMISQSFVSDFTQRMMPAIEAIEPSFFELTVAMAFDYFVQQNVDIAIIETGLGGRLDSTNVILPELSIITNIGYDHMNLLGNTLDKIAYEKAGIIKAGIPVVIGETLPETKVVFLQKALGENAPIHFAEDIIIEKHALLTDELQVQFNNAGHSVLYATDLAGLYQQYNLRTVVAALGILQTKGWRFNTATTRYALLHVKALAGLHGRWEIIQKHPFVVLDVGHNEDGVKQILLQVAAFKNLYATARIKIVMGMVRDKEVEKVLALFPVDFTFYFTNAHLPRALPAIELQQKAAAAGLKGEVYDNVNIAINAALKAAGSNDLIIVCGSVFVVGEVDTAQ